MTEQSDRGGGRPEQPVEEPRETPGATAPPWVRAGVGGALAVLLVAGVYLVVEPFLVSLVWAAVLAFTGWPLVRVLRPRLSGSRTVAAALATTVVFLAVVGPLAGASAALIEEVRGALGTIDALRDDPPAIPDWVRDLALIAGLSDDVPRRLEPELVEGWLRRNVEVVQDFLLDTVGRLGRNLLKTVITLLALFYLFRDGDRVVQQIRDVARHFGGDVVEARLVAIGRTVRAVVFGLLATSFVQAVLATIGFAVAGVPAPVLLGIVTGFLGLIPYGMTAVWAPAALWLLFSGKLVAAVGLAIWGTLVVASMDNLLRPAFISGATRVPYLLVFFGVLGGIAAFGLVGLFVGPVLLSVLLALWREWAATGAASRARHGERAGGGPQSPSSAS